MLPKQVQPLNYKKRILMVSGIPSYPTFRLIPKRNSFERKIKWMRILHILEPLTYGGVEKMVLFLAHFLIENEHEVHVAVPTNMMKNVLKHYNGKVQIYELKYSNSYNAFSVTKAIARALKCVSPDLIHTHARRPMVFTCLVNKAIPHIRTYHMEERERIPKLKFEYDLIRKRVNGWSVTWRGIIDKDLKNINITNNPISVIPNGVPKIKVRKTSNNGDCLELLFVGRLSYQKGLDILINGLSVLPLNKRKKLKLTIVGDGELKESLEKQVEMLKLTEIVAFEGFHDDLNTYYTYADLLVMPSRYEGLPLSLIESMSCSTPVVATCVGAIPTIIEDGKNGFLIYENNAEEWANFFEKIITTRVTIEIGALAKDTYDRFFTVGNMCQRYLELYECVVGSSV